MAEWVTPSDEGNMWTVAFKCVKCNLGILALVNPYVGIRPSQGSGDLAVTRAFDVLEIYPKIPSPDVPRFLPPNIEKFYRQALDNENRKNWDSCGAMCRKVLDVATKEKGADQNDGMKKRLSFLQQNGILSPALVEWADAIWKDGNDASHDSDPFSPEEAQQIRSFTELFLMYVYTLPGMLKDRQSNTSPPTP